MADDKPPPYNYNYGATQENQAPPPYQAGYQQPDYGKQGGYPQQPYPGQQYPGQPQTTGTTIITQPASTVIVNVVYREFPLSMVCSFCQTHIVTATTYRYGALTWLLSGGICLLGGWLGCCLIPFCLDGCKDVIHTCPNCQAQLGVYRRL